MTKRLYLNTKRSTKTKSPTLEASRPM